MNNHPRLLKLIDFLKKPSILFTFRVMISGLLLFFLYQMSAFEKISTVFHRINAAYLIGFFILFSLSLCAQVLRWKYLLRVWDIQQNFGDLLKWYLMGLFLNNFFPGGLGGDAFRLYSGTRSTKKLGDMAATIFYERVLSYSALVTLGLSSLIIRANYSKDKLFWLLLGFIFLGLAMAFLFLILPGFEILIAKIIERFHLMQKMQLQNWYDSFRFKVYHPRVLVAVCLLSFAIQFSDVLSYRVVASAIQLPVQLSDLFLFVPLLYLAILLPFSINGIGIREMVFVFFAIGWGISQSDAVAFSLTVFTLNLAGSLAGAPIYWFRRR